MKLKILVVVVVVALAWVAGQFYSQGAPGGTTTAGDESRLALSDTEQVINDSFQLEPGARIEVSGINGPVEVLTIAGQTAEVHVKTTARDGADLESRKLTVRQTPTGLIVHAESSDGFRFWRWLSGGEVRHHVTLKVPRQVELSTSGVNGRVQIGQVAGAVRVSGINGRVEVARATDAVHVSGVNGAVTIGVGELGGEGVRVSGVNGSVEVRFGENLNADVNVNGLNGGFSVNAPNVTTEEPPNRSSRRARIGHGGTPISISGVNGSVRLNRM